MSTGAVGLTVSERGSRSWQKAAAVIGGILVGLLSTSLGLFYPWVIAVVLFILGAVSHRREFGFAALGVLVGTAGWWLLALWAASNLGMSSA